MSRKNTKPQSELAEDLEVLERLRLKYGKLVKQCYQKYYIENIRTQEHINYWNVCADIRRNLDNLSGESQADIEQALKEGVIF